MAVLQSLVTYLLNRLTYAGQWRLDSYSIQHPTTHEATCLWQTFSCSRLNLDKKEKQSESLIKLFNQSQHCCQPSGEEWYQDCSYTMKQSTTLPLTPAYGRNESIYHILPLKVVFQGHKNHVRRKLFLDIQVT